MYKNIFLNLVNFSSNKYFIFSRLDKCRALTFSSKVYLDLDLVPDFVNRRPVSVDHHVDRTRISDISHVSRVPRVTILTTGQTTWYPALLV